MPHILVERDFLLQFDGYFAVEVLFSSGDSAAGVSAEGTEDAEGAEVPAVGEADSVGRGAAGREATAGFRGSIRWWIYDSALNAIHDECESTHDEGNKDKS